MGKQQQNGESPNRDSLGKTPREGAICERCGVPAWKRVLDITCVLLAMPVVLPVGFVISAIIKLMSPGPVLFKQERVGFKGRSFMCLKFRTMHAGADTHSHQKHLKRLIDTNSRLVKLDSKGDPRLIPCGRLLRMFGLDELPQLINVLRGEMSLVGPRPCIPYEYEQFTDAYKRRCDTLPGLTGLWQVKGKNKTTFEEMMALDLDYANTKSVLLDLKIIGMTIPAIVNQARDARAGSSSVEVTSPGAADKRLSAAGTK
jgi:exopolysaccharide production protein ExoY